MNPVLEIEDYILTQNKRKRRRKIRATSKLIVAKQRTQDISVLFYS